MSDENVSIDLYEMFATDSTKEKDGVWLNYGSNPATDPAFHVRRAGGENRKYQQILASRMRPYQRILNDKGRLPDEATIRAIENIHREAWRESCLLNWRNIKDKDKTLLEFSPENVKKHMVELPELYRDLMEQSGSTALFRMQEVQDAAKN